MSDASPDVMINNTSASSDERGGARLLHGAYDGAMSPELVV